MDTDQILNNLRTALKYKKTKKLKVLILNTASDKQLAKELITIFRDSGFPCWDGENCILPGQDHNTEQEKAVYEADIILGMMSKSSVITTGRYSALLKLALDAQLEQPSGTIKFIAILMDGCDLPYEFKKYLPLNMTQDGAVDILVRSLKKREQSQVVEEKRSEAIWK